MSGIVHKVKNALRHDSSTTRSTTSSTHDTSGVPEGTAGPHSSKIANAVDPRVDSDLDSSNRRAGASGVDGTGYGGTTGPTSTTGTTMTGAGVGSGISSGTGAGSHTGGHGNSSAAYGSTTAGPHESSIANKTDPRVNSTTGAHTIGLNTGAGYGVTGGAYGTTGQTGTTGVPSQSSNAGPHNSNMANKLDPRVDSDLDSRGQRHVAGGTHTTPGSGYAQNTAGPHNLDILNQADPRIDSNLGGSTTLGGNRTYTTYKDPPDAASVPPSVMRESIGDPEVLHDDKKHSHARRHGSVSIQDPYKGL